MGFVSPLTQRRLATKSIVEQLTSREKTQTNAYLVTHLDASGRMSSRYREMERACTLVVVAAEIARATIQWNRGKQMDALTQKSVCVCLWPA